MFYSKAGLWVILAQGKPQPQQRGVVPEEAMAATPPLAEDEEGDVPVETILVVRKGTTRPMGREGSLIPWTHPDGREGTKRDLRTYKHPTWVGRQHITRSSERRVETLESAQFPLGAQSLEDFVREMTHVLYVGRRYRTQMVSSRL